MIDAFIIIVFLWSVFNGWRTGFIKEITSTLGILVGLLIAATCYAAFGKFLAVDGSETNMVTSIIAFFLLWIIVPIVLGLVANVLTKSLKGMQLGTPNSILGALVSVVKNFLILSCVFNVMTGLHILNTEKAESSKLLPPVAGALHLFFSDDADGQTVAPNDSTAEKTDTVWVNLSDTTRNKK